MLQDVWEGLGRALGLGVETEQLGVGQMGLRALVIFAVGLAIVRLGDKRFLGRSTAFDALLAVILGSVLGRAINGTAPFFPTIVACLLLVALHWILAFMAFHFDRFGNLVKGKAVMLVSDGEIRWDGMRKSHITENDLGEALRINAQISDPGKVQTACLERSGDISVIPHDHAPRILEVKVEAGVQRVRIEI